MTSARAVPLTALANAIDAVLVDEPDFVAAVARVRALESHAARDSALAEVFEKALYRALARNPGLAATGPGTFVHSLQLARTRGSALVFAREFTAALGLSHNRNLADVLDPSITVVRPVTEAVLDAVSELGTRDLGTRRMPLPSAMSRRLTTWAARILPAPDRPVYDELFRAELVDLASRRAQLGHAVRVLVRAPLLRRELRR